MQNEWVPGECQNINAGSRPLTHSQSSKCDVKWSGYYDSSPWCDSSRLDSSYENERPLVVSGSRCDSGLDGG